jgi:Uracil phosphoribosyltransferase
VLVLHVRVHRRPTANCCVLCVQVLLEKGVVESRILFLSLIAAPEGIHKLCKTYPRIKVVTSEIDEGLDGNFQVVPGEHSCTLKAQLCHFISVVARMEMCLLWRRQLLQALASLGIDISATKSHYVACFHCIASIQSALLACH